MPVVFADALGDGGADDFSRSLRARSASRRVETSFRTPSKALKRVEEP